MTSPRLLALYVTVVAIWGTTWIAMREAVETVPAITASGLRFAIAFPLLALIVARRPGIPLATPRARRSCSRLSRSATSRCRSS